MKLNELQNRVRTDSRFKEARIKMRHDLAFQIGHTIENLRLSEKLSQAQFAKRAGLQQPAVARMERGVVVPSLPLLQRIAKAFKRELLLPVFTSSYISSVRADATSTFNSQDPILSPYQKVSTGTYAA